VSIPDLPEGGSLSAALPPGGDDLAAPLAPLRLADLQRVVPENTQPATTLPSEEAGADRPSRMREVVTGCLAALAVVAGTTSGWLVAPALGLAVLAVMLCALVALLTFG